LQRCCSLLGGELGGSSSSDVGWNRAERLCVVTLDEALPQCVALIGQFDGETSYCPIVSCNARHRFLSALEIRVENLQYCTVFGQWLQKIKTDDFRLGLCYNPRISVTSILMYLILQMPSIAYKNGPSPRFLLLSSSNLQKATLDRI